MNALHTALQAAFYQANPVIGSTATIGNVANVAIIVSAVDERIVMEMEGYLSDADYVGVVSTSDFSNVPVENTQVTGPDGSTYTIRAVKSDPSAYLLALKKISI